MPYTVDEKGAPPGAPYSKKQASRGAPGMDGAMGLQTKSLVEPQGAQALLFWLKGFSRRTPNAPAVLCRTVLVAE